MRKGITLLIFVIIFVIINTVLYRNFDNDYFNIKTYYSSIDKDADKIDDQTDILRNAKKYITKKPKYKTKDDINPNIKYNGSIDLVIYSLKNAGYNLEVIIGNDYKNFDKIVEYLNNNAISLTTDIKEKDKWQGGDIVVFKNQMGIISDKRNINGISYVIHHIGPLQIKFEEDVLEDSKDIIGHYRIS